MRIFHSQNALDGAAFRKLPSGTIKDIMIRFEGTAQTGQTVTLDNLGRFRINIRGTDTHNLTFSLLNAIDNLKYGAIAASSTTGGAFNFAFVVPLHAFWDMQNGTYVGEDEGFIELSFPAMTSSLIASGTVRLSYNSAPRVSTYQSKLLQRNIQIGGAGQVAQDLEFKNISSLYIQDSSSVTQILVTADGREYANDSRQAFLDYSNAMNRVETALTLFEVDLNPFDEIRSDLNNEVRIILTSTGSLNYDVVAEMHVPTSAEVISKSSDFVQKNLRAIEAEDTTT